MAATRHQSHQGMSWITYLLAICAGGANPAQAGANAQLNKSLGSTVWAGIFIYLSGLLGMLLALAIFRQTFPASGKMAETPWWAWTGGLVSLWIHFSGTYFCSKNGLRAVHRLERYRCANHFHCVRSFRTDRIQSAPSFTYAACRWYINDPRALANREILNLTKVRGVPMLRLN